MDGQTRKMIMTAVAAISHMTELDKEAEAEILEAIAAKKAGKEPKKKGCGGCGRSKRRLKRAKQAAEEAKKAEVDKETADDGQGSQADTGGSEAAE